jgi:hypothetical protein
VKYRGLASGLVCLLAGGCGGGTSPLPAAPSSIGSPSALATTPGTPFLGVGAADLAVCLRGSQEPACFSAEHLRTRAIGAPVTAPGAPSNLTVTVTGNSVTLVWSGPTSGDAVLSYVLEAGSASGAANLANIVTNSTATTFSASGIGAGTYFVRVRAQNAGGLSASSNEVVVVVVSLGCTSAPGTPGGLSSSVNVGTVTLVWSPLVGGCSPTSYILQVGSAPGLSNLANFNTGNSATTYVATGVGSGTYYVRVLAQNGSGQSPASNEVVVTVGSTGPRPNLIVNGGFESPPLSFSFLTFTAPTSFLGWAVTSGQVDVVHRTFYASASGSQSLDLNGYQSGSASQTVVTRPGGVYTLTFAFAANTVLSFDSPRVRRMEVRWGPTVIANLDFDTMGFTATNVGWRQYTFSVIGSGTDTISFKSLTVGNAGPAIDDVSLVEGP